MKKLAWALDKRSGKNFFGKNGPSHGWWLNFKKRYPDICRMRKADPVDHGRAQSSNAEALRDYFALLSEVINDNELNLKPECIFNCDETIVDLNKSTQKVIVPKTLKNAHSRNVSSSEHITIHVCVNAAGNALSPLIIFKASMLCGKYSDQGPEQAVYGKVRVVL